MKRNIRKSLMVAAIGGLSLFGLTGCFYAEAPEPTAVVATPGVEVVAEPPPPAPYEEPGPPPGVGFIWIGGFYDWDHGHYVWRRGHWDHDHDGRHWEHDRWEHGEHGYVHVRGHWD
jgi:hypothetical protein